MTDYIDYTRHEAVLKACGWHVEEGYLMNLKGEYWSSPTMQELWETLCRVCVGTMYHPMIEGENRVYLQTYNQHLHGKEPEAFSALYYGSLCNTIAAALHWVLQQAEKREG